MSGVRTGLDRIADGDREACALLRGRRIGLMAHPASVDRYLRHARVVLEAAGAELACLFGPEHGYGGEAQDMIGVRSTVGADGVRVCSLYGETEEDLRPRPEWLEGLDAVVVDLQDIGTRFYTFVWSAALMLEVAAPLGVQTVVLDRPNPLGGDVVEGAPQRPGYRSFVGLYDVSVRHGLTIGEVTARVRRERGLDEASLAVVRMDGWQRAMRWEATGLPWVLPSPNMPTPDTARVYPGGCLIEGTTLSEGRGATRPFEIWGAPFVDGARLAAEVRLEGATLRPLRFRPMFHKHGGTDCGGVQVHVTDEGIFRPYEAYLRLLAAARAAAPEEPFWRTEPYEYVHDRPAIDLLTGGPEYREAVEAGVAVGAVSLDALLEADRHGADTFELDRRQDLLYAPD